MSVEPDELKGSEQAVLLVLMAEARPVRNPDLALLGPELRKPDRDRLVGLGLIDVDGRSRPMTVELSDRGWAICAKLIGADSPVRASAQGRALYTVLRALRRHLDRADLAPADVFLPLEDAPPDGNPDPLRGDPDPLRGDLEARVRATYVRLAARDGGWVDLVRLREELSDVSRSDLDRTLTRMYRIPGVSLVPVENQKTLTSADRAAAIDIGDQHKHRIAIED